MEIDPNCHIYFTLWTFWLFFSQNIRIAIVTKLHTSTNKSTDIFLKKYDVNMAYYKIDKIHLNTRGSKALAKEIKKQI